MLASLESDVGAALYDALCAKADYERGALLEFVESEAVAADSKKRPGAVLEAEYFVRKPLDPNSL